MWLAAAHPNFKSTPSFANSTYLPNVEVDKVKQGRLSNHHLNFRHAYNPWLTKTVVVLSGKGGVGKTTIASSLAYLYSKDGAGIVAVDADVDAPDLEYFLGGGKLVKHVSVETSDKALIDMYKCVGCGKCVEVCIYGALRIHEGKARVEKIMCEGCGACMYVCPTDAISLEKHSGGLITVKETRYGFKIVTGRISLGEHNSGKMVSTARAEAYKIAKAESLDVIVVDGAPGIGCPVIASLTGADYVVAVVEPTKLSHQGLTRLLDVVEHFKIKAGVVINKHDISEEWAGRITSYVTSKGYKLLGQIPLSREVVEAMSKMVPLPEYYPKGEASQRITGIYREIRRVVEA